MSRKPSSRQTVLFTCAGGSGPIYLARMMRRRFNVIMADADPASIGSQLGYPFYRLPFGNDPSYASALRRIVKRHKVDIVVPGADEELLPAAALVADDPPVKVVMPGAAFTTLCLNKKHLMVALDRAGISHLLPFSTRRAVRFPAITKPIVGRGSRNVHLVTDAARLSGYLNLHGTTFSNVLVQPYIDGTEFTVSVIVNNLNKLVGIVPKRIIVKKGITRAAVTQRSRAIERVCHAIVDQFQPAGPFNVQLMVAGREIYIFEINPRLSTTTVLTERAFGNEVELYARYFDRTSFPALPPMRTPVYLYRFEENVFR